jgi:serine/threonine-protein kinase
MTPKAPTEFNAPVDKIGVRTNDSRVPKNANRAPFLPGTVLAGKYWLLNLLRVSHVGTLYDAVRENVSCARVAVKVLDPKLAEREDLLPEFLREAQISHPNIVTILDFTCAPGGPPLLAMEPLRGRTLSAAIASDPPFSPRRVAHVAAQILAALHAAHAAGVLHRDLKPGSVFLARGSERDDIVKVLHFGFAKLTDPDQKDRIAVIQTPAYMAPEQTRGDPPCVASDIYTVGCVMYEALTGRAPFIEESFTELVRAVQDRDPLPLSEMRPDIPPPFVAIVERAMAREPRLRFTTAKDMERALKRWARARQIPVN